METQDVDLLLIGKTGNGKSATGNSILMKSKSFVAKPMTQSVTMQVHFDYSLFNDRMIKVVDGPGVGDTRMSDVEALTLIQDRLMHAITANPKGYHAFILVVRYGGRFTKEDSQTIYCLKQIFGLDFVKNFCILMVTCGDNFQKDHDEKSITFYQWVQDQEGDFKEILRECNYRVVLFDNKTKDETKKNEQVKQLLSAVDKLGGKRYTDKHFEKAGHLREKLMAESKEPHAREETLKETAFLTQSLEALRKKAPQNQLEGLRELERSSKTLTKKVQDQDKGTGALRYSIEAVKSIEKRIESQINHCHEVIRAEKADREEKDRIENEHSEKWKKQREDYEKSAQQDRIKREKEAQTERNAAEKRWEEQKQAQGKRYKKRLEELRKELENASKEERLQRERDLTKMMEEEAEKAEEIREQERRELEDKLQRQVKEDEENLQKRKKEMEKKHKKEVERWNQEERDRAEKYEAERRDEKLKHEKDLEKEKQKTEEAFDKAKGDTENFIVSGIATVASAALKIFLISRLGPGAVFLFDLI